MYNQILKDVIDFYDKSSDFNGIPLYRLLGKSKGKAKEELVESIRKLVSEKLVSVCYSTNPHIKCFPDEPIERQLDILGKNKPNEICIYPTESVLQNNVDTSKFEDKPFSKMLAFGKPQLIPPLYFDIVVLENYFNDPRYHIDYYDYGGSVCYTDEMEDRDKALIQSFGIGYRNKDNERVVVVYLRYLADLTAEHQQRWLTHLLKEDCVMAYPYYQNTILGDWAEEPSIYEAFLEELFHIRKMTSLAFGKTLLLNDYKDNRPSDFKIIFRPTLENYHKFVQCLDKLMSDNISSAFFKGQFDLKDVDGQKKGTITLLDEWLRKRVRVSDIRIYDEIIKPFREVRDLRQKPAHKVNKNQYDKSYFRMQNELMHNCYVAVRDIRLLLTNHPLLNDYKVPDWLFYGKIAKY